MGKYAHRGMIAFYIPTAARKCPEIPPLRPTHVRPRPTPFPSTFGRQELRAAITRHGEQNASQASVASSSSVWCSVDTYGMTAYRYAMALVLVLAVLAVSHGVRYSVDLSHQSNYVSLFEKEAWFVQYYKPNCRYCEDAKPIWDQLAREYEGDVQFGEVDITTHIGKEMAVKYEIDGTPTFILYRNGVAYEYKGSAKSLEMFVDFINGDYHPLWKLAYRPLTFGAIVWVPTILIFLMCFVAFNASDVSVEEFGQDIGAYTPPDAEEVLSQPLVSAGLTRRSVPRV